MSTRSTPVRVHARSRRPVRAGGSEYTCESRDLVLDTTTIMDALSLPTLPQNQERLRCTHLSAYSCRPTNNVASKDILFRSTGSLGHAFTTVNKRVMKCFPFSTPPVYPGVHRSNRCLSIYSEYSERPTEYSVLGVLRTRRSYVLLASEQRQNVCL
jgi:hypothetical protein